MNVDFNPWDSFGKGMQIGNAFFENADLARKQMIAEKERAALSQMGQGNKLMGLENTPKATRPAWLQALYQDHPEAAMKAEQYVAAPFTEQRKAKQAEASQLAMLQAKGNAFAQAVRAMGGEGEGPPAQPAIAQPINAFATQMNGEPSSVGLVSEGGVAVPGGPTLENPAGRGSTQNLLSGKNLDTASRMKKTRRVSFEHGPSVEYEEMPELQAEQMRTEAAQKGRQMELNAQKTADDLRVSADTTRRQADEQVYGLQRELTEVKKSMTGSGIIPRDAIARINELNDELKAAKARRDSLYFGKDAPAPESAQLTPQEQAKAAAVRAGKGQSARPSPPAASPLDDHAPESIGAGLPYQQQVEAQKEKLKGDLTQTRTILDAAHASANSALQNKPATDRIMELLQKNDLGSRTLKLPGATTAATILSGNYDELNKWRNSLILQEKAEGESQLYNTLPELKIHSESLPAVDNDENTNRRAIVPVKNLMEARLVAPKFLEDWAKQHGGTLDGARQEFRSWMQHNPLYQAAEKNGAVSIHENTQYIPLEAWTRLRQRFSEKDILAKQKSGGIQVISGRVFFKE